MQTEIQQLLLEKALQQLQALPVRFAVEAPSGKTYGNAALEKPPAPDNQLPLFTEPKAAGRYKHRKARDHYTHLGYREQVAALQPGQYLALPVPDSVNAEGYYDTVTNKARRLFKTGNFLTTLTQDHRTIEVLRIA